MKTLQQFVLFLTSLILTTSCFAQNWERIQALEVSDPENLERIGTAVGLLDSILWLGAPFEDADPENEVPESGAVYLFKKQADGSWIEWLKINSPNQENLGFFGHAAALNGNRLLIGAYNEDKLEGPFLNSGNVYLYNLDPSLGILDTFIIENPYPDNADYFGDAVAMDGNTVIIGAYNEDEDANNENTLADAGAVYVYESHGIDSILVAFTQKLVASDRGEDDNFGRYLDINGDRMIISAFKNTDEANFFSEAGAAYIFELQDNGQWIEVQKLLASDREFFDQFGWDVAIDGDWAMIGARNEKHAPDGSIIPNIGTVYVFQRGENGVWEEVQKLFAEDFAANDLFGGAIDIDGRIAVIGADWEDEDENGNNTVSAAGSAYVFELDEDDNWKQMAKIIGADRAINDWFGASVAIHKDQILVGATAASGSLGATSNPGGAYIFKGDIMLNATDISSSITFKIFPNPSSSLIYLQSQSPIFEAITIAIYTLQGEMVHQETISMANQLQAINLNTLAEGMYWMQLTQNKKWIATEKILIIK